MSTKTMTTTSSYASKSDLLALTGTRRFRDVSLPVCGLTVRIRSLTEGELSAYYAHVAAAKTDNGRAKRMENATRRLFAQCLVDAEGNRLLSDHEADSLANMDAADSQRLYDACAEHTGINQRDIEELAKNSAATGGDRSPTG